MKVKETEIEGVLIVEPAVFEDKRGTFMETYHRQRYDQQGINVDFVQDNMSYSKKGILRGLHYQYPSEQAKLVYVLKGEVFDVAVDIRQESPAFGKVASVILTEQNNRQFFIPKGFAHGFCVLSATAVVSYKCSDFFNPKDEGGILWSDPDLKINWPIKAPLLSEKDSAYKRLRDILSTKLPVYKD